MSGTMSESGPWKKMVQYMLLVSNEGIDKLQRYVPCFSTDLSEPVVIPALTYVKLP